MLQLVYLVKRRPGTTTNKTRRRHSEIVSEQRQSANKLTHPLPQEAFDLKGQPRS